MSKLFLPLKIFRQPYIISSKKSAAIYVMPALSGIKSCNHYPANLIAFLSVIALKSTRLPTTFLIWLFFIFLASYQQETIGIFFTLWKLS